MQPTEEQIKEFWEWCGFKYNFRDFGRYDRPDTSCCQELPPIDLNSLFKYAVPRLGMYELNSYNQGGFHFAWVSLLEDGGWVSADSEDPALALFWVIYKVIENELANR